MEQMLREWRLRNHKRQAQEGRRPPYRRIATVTASYLAWGAVVFWAFNVVEYVGVWLALLYWLSNPPLLIAAGCRALMLDGQELVRYEFGDVRDIRGWW